MSPTHAALMLSVALLWTNIAPADDLSRMRFVNVQPVPGIEFDAFGQACCQGITPDGKELVFASNIEGFGGWDLYVARRSQPDQPFEEVIHLGEDFNGTNDEAGASFTSDGLTMFFPSRSKGIGNYDIFMATRKSVDEWFSDVKPVPSLNTELRDGEPSISRDGKTIYFTRADPLNSADRDIHVADWDEAEEQFVDIRKIAALDSPFRDTGPSISRDGLQLIYTVDDGNLETSIIRVASRLSVDQEFGNPIPINEFGAGSMIEVDGNISAAGTISADWPDPGSKLFFTRAYNPCGGGLFEIPNWNLHEATWTYVGDLDVDGELDADDIDMLSSMVGAPEFPYEFDLDDDGRLTNEDRFHWVHDIKNTWFGDSNLDGEFNSRDFVEVFQAGEYEDDIPGNSTWATGDWNGDQEFDSVDFVVAFQDGGFEMGPRDAARAVPEPSGVILLTLAVVGFATQSRRRGTNGK